MPTSIEKRVVVLAPTARDAALTISLLGSKDIDAVACTDVDQAVREIEGGVGALLVAKEFVAGARCAPIIGTIAAHPPWSDLPVLLITAQGADSPAVALALESLGNVTVIERPTRVTALVSTVQTALRARERQYQARDYLLER